MIKILKISLKILKIHKIFQKFEVFRFSSSGPKIPHDFFESGINFTVFQKNLKFTIKILKIGCIINVKFS